MPYRFAHVSKRSLLVLAGDYAAALAISAAAVWASILLRVVSPNVPFSLLIIAVLLSANVGGIGPALVATVILSYVGPVYLIAPYGELPHDQNSLVRVAMFALTCLVGTYLTVRKRDALVKLRQVVATRDLMARATNDCVRDWNLRTGIIHWNDAAESVFGVHRVSSGNDLRSWTDAIHPADTERVLSGLQHVIDSGRDGWTDHYRFRKKDGTYASVLDRGYVTRDSRGQATQIVGSMLDLTERMAAQQLLVENEERLRTALEAGRAGVWDWDIPGGQIAWSDRVFEIHGVSRATFTGKLEEFTSLIHPADGERVQAAIDAAIGQRAPYAVEFRIVRPNGEVRWVQTNARVIYDAEGRAVRMVGAMLDITDRRAEQTQKEIMANLGDALSSSFKVEEVVKRVMNVTVPALADWCLVRVHDAARGASHSDSTHIVPAKAALMAKAREARPFDPESDEAAARVLRSGAPEFVPDLSAENADRWSSAKDQPAFWSTLGTNSFLCVPLRSPSGVIGAMSLGLSESNRRLSEDELRFSEDVGRRVGLAVENALLYQQAQLELAERRTKENQLRLVTDSMPALVSYITTDHVYRFANAAYLDWFKLTSEQILGRHVRDVLGEKTYLESVPFLEEALKGETIRFERKMKVPSLGEVWLDATYTPHLEDGVVRGVFVMALDVTQSRKSEDRISRQAQLLDLAHDAIIVRTVDGQITFWNKGAEDLYGWKAADALAKNSHELFGTEFPAPLAEINRKLEVKGEWEGELVHRTRAGETITVGSRWVIAESGEGAATVLEINRDITERKRYELHLLAQAEELSRSNQELEQFAYVASHDLQEPLRKISNYTELLASRVKGKLEADADRYLNTIVASAQRMQQLIHDLLAYSRLTKSDAARAPIPLNRVLDLVVSDLETRIHERGARVSVEPGLPSVLASATEIRQVFQNMIGNALKFNEAPEPEVRVFRKKDAPSLTIGVSDNGIGIDAAYHDKIFKVFHRLHTRDKFPGTGIGLAICKKIIERHGGRIWVESSPSGGSTFYFTLPEAVETEAAAVTASTSDVPAS